MPYSELEDVGADVGVSALALTNIHSTCKAWDLVIFH